MVAAGAAALMPASDSGSSKGNEAVSTQYESQNAQRSSDNQTKRTSKVGKKSSFRSPISGKTTPIRETKASRLRAASIVSPTEGTPTYRKTSTPDSLFFANSQTGTSSLRKTKSPMSSTSRVPSCVTRERDKTAKRASVALKSPEAEEKRHELHEKNEAPRMRRTNVKQSSSNKTDRLADGHENLGLARRTDAQHQSTGVSATSRLSSAIASSSGMKTRSSTQRTSVTIGTNENSEVLRRVDALTALTRATMERVERLASHSTPATNGKSRNTDHQPSAATLGKNSTSTKKPSRFNDNQEATNSRYDVVSASKTNSRNNNKNDKNNDHESETPCETSVTIRQKLRQQPISILKHKSPESTDAISSASGNFTYKTVPQTTNSGPASTIEQLTKKHGILKKRSSLDDNEIRRRRRSCSPETAYPEVNSAEFKPILKYERRSSLDELIKRSRSPDHYNNHQQQQQPHPTSILKRKSLGDEERDDGQSSINEPTSILKRTSGNGGRNGTLGHHVSIIAAVARTLGYHSDVCNSSEVRPILKKKFSREESSSSDPPSLEPRPILKKKSSTDSDEHDDKPKTILKSSRKSSQEDSGNEIDAASPKKLSMLKNRSIQRRTNSLPECDVVRPILKQSSSRESSSPSRSSLSDNTAFGDSSSVSTKDLFLRKRARSVGHMQSTLNESDDWIRAQGSLRQNTAVLSQIKRDRNHSQNIISSRSNESTTSVTTTATTTTTTATTTTTIATTATSSIAPIVSFKLPSRCEMKNRYEMDDEDCHSLGDEGTNHGCSDFHYNSNKGTDEDDDDDEDVNVDHNEARYTSRQASRRQSEKWNATAASSDSQASTKQKSRYSPIEIKDSDKENSDNGATNEISSNENSGVTTTAENGSKVSKIAQRFKILEEQTKCSDERAERRGNTTKYSRDSRDPQRHERFVTQPVTYEEVREAVLQNQRKAAINELEAAKASRDLETIVKTSEMEPSKLSLADRVRLFNRRIATESIEKVSASIDRASQRRRPSNRYKTQPITSEEVEVASRIFPVDKVEREADKCDSLGEAKSMNISKVRLPSQPSSNATQPRSILKHSTSQIANENRSFRARDPRRETDAAGVIDEAYLLSSDLKLTRREFDTRRSYRRKRNGEFESETNGNENGACKRTNEENFDVRCSTDVAGLDRAGVSHSSDNFALLEKAGAMETGDGCDTADNVETTNLSLIASRRTRQRGTTIEKSFFVSQTDNVSHGKRDKLTTEGQQVDFPSISIADRLAALQRSGTTDWKRRVTTETVMVSTNSVKFISNETAKDTTSQAEKDEIATKQRKLAERLEKLESAAEGWRKRVAVPDALKFSVAGKMRVEQNDISEQLSPLIEVAANSVNDGKKKIPRPERFRSCKFGRDSENIATTTGEKNSVRESSSGSVSEDSAEDEARVSSDSATILSVPRADDETFTSFFSNVSFAKCEAETLDFPETDFDIVTSFSQRLGTRRTVKTQRRRLPSKNPLRTLAARTDLKDEYTETTTGVAERMMRTLNVEKFSSKSSLAVEALAALASTEDFGAVTLKNVDVDATGYGNRLPPHKDVMLILVKGRRHVQIRLVEPTPDSINSGDNFILVTKNDLYNYVGKYSNVIERARGAEIALSIQQNRDLGCRASQVITLSEEKPTCTSAQIMHFWKILGAEKPHSVEVVDAGHPDEDELYESALLDTNMVYEVVGEDELLPLDKYWGAMPKIEMLDPSKILVFDFGSEMYIWNGKIAPTEKRKVATQLAEELWQEGYDYSECTVSPINAASIIGRRTKLEKNVKKSSSRPEWCLLGKLTQHMETVLFREKFMDWPNVSGIIRVKESAEKEQVDGKIIVEPPEVDAMLDHKSPVVDFILEGSHLGRGKGWYDDESMRQFVVATTNVTVWHIDEFSCSLLGGSSIGQFYTGDSYIVRWMYTVTITGRGLSGEPSKHASKGRDRCAYFIWQGRKASLNEQGAAALLTVEFDQEQGPQIRVPEGFEPAAFLNLFSGGMIVHNGKKAKAHTNKKWRMYICRGNEETETSLAEVPCSTRQLRSRSSLLLLDTISGKIYVWHGRAALPHLKQNALRAASILKRNRPEEAGLRNRTDVTICEINESDEEPAAFFEALGGMNKQLYVPLEGNRRLNHTPRLFHLSSVSGEFAATELLSPHRGDIVTPFPFLQDELYQVNQPALFLLDNMDELWLWQGWWPDGGCEDQTGSGAVRWQAERRAAMITAMRYWEKIHPKSDNCFVYLVWAGLEPLEFTNLFPTWNYRDDIAELNIKDGRDSGKILLVESELARLTQSTYPIAQLLQRPLPDGVDPTILEKYLSPQHFEELLGMNVEEFEKLPAWKQINVKKKIGLF